MSRSPGFRRHAFVEGGSRPGFTLLEVLVVVGIIALLIAILMPTIVTARRRAHRVTCQSQVRQLVTAWHVLLEANRGQFPYGPTMSVDFGGKQGLANTHKKQPKPLNKYLGLSPITYVGADVFRCPSDRKGTVSGQESYQVDARTTCFDYYGTSYKANRFLVGADVLASPVDPSWELLYSARDRFKTPLNRSQLYDEPRLILLGDFGWEHAWNLASSMRIEWHGRPGWHNIGFMDGHADFTPIYKGVYVDDRYTLVPFRNLQREALKHQPRH